MKMEPLNSGTSERVSLYIVVPSLYAEPSFYRCIHFPAVSMHLLYVLKCSQFFNTLDTDFFPADSPDNDEDDEEEGEESRGRAKKHKIKHVSKFQTLKLKSVR